MSKKKINIVLIIVVLGLWGTVVYRSLNHYFLPNQDQNAVEQRGNSFNYQQIKKDTFELSPLHRDPFLSKQMAPATPIVYTKPSAPIVKKTAAVKAPPQPTVVYWPEINYYGYIKSSQKISELILIKINNKLYKTRKNDIVEGIKIKTVFKDSIEMQLNKEVKLIYLKR